MKHTQGPWKVIQTATIDEMAFVETKNSRFDIFPGTPQMPNYDQHDNDEWWDSQEKMLIDEANANAMLIAAAPTMADYIEYVDAKIAIDEMPFTYDQRKLAESDMAE